MSGIRFLREEGVAFVPVFTARYNGEVEYYACAHIFLGLPFPPPDRCPRCHPSA